ncbi:MAG: hypothetical protein IJ512_07245 [Ruminococcus sp.]|nr:hypothetical protein [Ruminococcus sp.]
MTKRKRICVVIACIFACSLWGCAESSHTAENNPTDPGSEKIGMDYTVTPASTYQIEGKDVRSSLNSHMDYAYDPSLSTQSELASLIAEGEIQAVYYTHVGRIAWTQLDVRLTSCPLGEFAEGDIISVYTLGGYVSFADHFSESEIRDFYPDLSEEEKENTLLLDEIEGVPLPEVGESYLFFLSPSMSGGPFPEGSYEVLMSYARSMFEIDGDAYVNENIGETFRSSELETAVLARTDDAPAVQ